MLSAFFSGTETAFVSANRLKLEIKWRQEKSRYRLVRHFIVQPERFLSTTLIGNNISNVLFSSISVLILVNFCPESMIVILSSFIIMLLGESLPKTIASQHPSRLVTFLAPILKFFEYLFYPINWAVNHSSAQLLNLLGIKQAGVKKFFSRDDLVLMIRELSQRGYFDRELQTIISKMIHLNQQKVRNILLPRTEIIAVSLNTSVEKAMTMFSESGYTRLPVFVDSVDNIVGIINARDFLEPPKSIAEVMTKPIIVPATQFSIKLFQEMRKKRISIGIVVDEYGGTLGLITIEDLLEEIVGEILDEFDVEKKWITPITGDTFILNGRAEIRHVNERLKISLPIGEYATIAGLLQTYLGKIPAIGEALEFHDIRLEVLSATSRTTEQVRLVIRRRQSQ